MLHMEAHFEQQAWRKTHHDEPAFNSHSMPARTCKGGQHSLFPQLPAQSTARKAGKITHAGQAHEASTDRPCTV